MDINGKEIDLSRVLPLKVKDWRELEKHGITVAELQKESIESFARFAKYCASKGNDSITHDDINQLELEELIAICNDFMPGKKDGEGTNFI